MLDLEYLESTTQEKDLDSEYCPSEHSFILIETDANKDTSYNTSNIEKQLCDSTKKSNNNSGLEVFAEFNKSNINCPDDINLNIDTSERSKGGNKKSCCSYC